MTPRFHQLRVAEVRRETPECVSLKFDLPAELADEYRFTQGQHLALRATLDGEELRRSYSVCAGCDDGELRVAVKKVPGGRFSAWVNEALQPGDAIDVMTPEGRFFTPLVAGAREALRRLRRRQRHHAGAVADPHDARARAEVALHARLRQPPPDLGDVPRGARGPEGPLPDALRAVQRVLARGAGHRALQRAARRRQGAGLPVDAGAGRHRSTKPSCAARPR